MTTNYKSTTVRADAVVDRDVDDEEREVLRVPISSTREDREGDAFSKDALEDMADQIRERQPLVFDDHGGGGLFGGGYSARETIGTQFDAELEEDDDDHHTLYAYVNPDHSHEEGERMLRQVRDEKQAIKFSVGFRILKVADDLPEDDRPGRANEIPGRLFMANDLLETSRVGIPANADASAPVTAAAKNGHTVGVEQYPAPNGTSVALSGNPAQLSHPQYAAHMGHQLASQQFASVGGDVESKGAGGAFDLRAELDELREDVADLTERVSDLKEGDGDDEDDDDDDEDDEEESGKESCDVDADCPDGEVCRDGKCVPEDEAESSDLDDAGDEELRERIADLEAALDKGHGDAKSGNTNATDKGDLPTDGKDADPDESKDGADADRSDASDETPDDESTDEQRGGGYITNY